MFRSRLGRMLTLFAVATLFNGSALAAEPTKLPVVNDTEAPMELWVKTEPKVWWSPQIFVPATRTKYLVLTEADKYYLVVRDDSQNDFHIGWIDLRAMLKKDPGLQLKLRVVYEQMTRKRWVWSRRCRTWIQVEEIVQTSKWVYHFMGSDGKPIPLENEKPDDRP